MTPEDLTPEGILIVQADSVADYLSRYYKPERMTDTLLESYTIEYECFGFVSTSHYDSILGKSIVWPKWNPDAQTDEAMEKWERMNAAQAERVYRKPIQSIKVESLDDTDTSINLSAFED